MLWDTLEFGKLTCVCCLSVIGFGCMLLFSRMNRRRRDNSAHGEPPKKLRRSKSYMNKSMEPLQYVFRPFQFTKVPHNSRVDELGSASVPMPRSGHRIVCNSSDLYSFGGYNPSILASDPRMILDPMWRESRPLFRELWRYNFATNLWTRLETSGSMPTELASHAAVLTGASMFIYGGTGVPFGSNSSNKLHIFNLNSLNWTTVAATGDEPLPQYGQAVTIDDGYFYTVGGTTGYQYSLDVHRLNLKTKEWEVLYHDVPLENPYARYRHEVACHKGTIYILGGGTSANVFDLEKMPSYCIQDRRWAEVRTVADTDNKFPLPRRCHSAVQLGNSIFVCGGYNGDTVFNDLWKLDLETMQWHSFKSTLPKAVYFHSAAVTPEGRMHVFGGVMTVQVNTRTADMYSIWLTIPKLKEICWEAVVCYAKDIKRYPRQKLLEVGVPAEFVERVNYQAACG